MIEENIITRESGYGGERCVRFWLGPGFRHGNFTLYFSGKRPAQGQLVLVKHVETLPEQDEAFLYYLKKAGWKRPSLDDFLDLRTRVDASNLQESDYTPEELRAFFAKHDARFRRLLDELLLEAESTDWARFGHWKRADGLLELTGVIAMTAVRRLGRILKSAKSVEALQELEEKAKRLQRYLFLKNGAKGVFDPALAQELEKAHYWKERHLVKQAHTMEPRQLIDTIKQAKSDTVAYQLKKIFMKRSVDENNRLRKEFEGFLEEAASTAGGIFSYDMRWTLPANATGISVDVSKAVESKAYLADAIRATRVGSISNDDPILIIPTLLPRGKPVWVKGNKALKRRVKEAGGKLKKYGCTLTAGDGTVYSSLMEIARLNALAALDPDAVVAFVKSKGKDAKRLEKLVGGAKADYRRARRLADVAVELVYNIDPDSAKKLISSFGI